MATPSKSPRRAIQYRLTEDDACRIDGLICMLGLAIQEILELSQNRRDFTADPDATVCLDSLQAELGRIHGDCIQARDRNR